MDQSSGFRHLPSVDLVLRTAAAEASRERFVGAALTAAVRAELEGLRRPRRMGTMEPPGADEVAVRAAMRLEATERPRLRPAFNLTCVVLHTNLGRAVLAE